MNSCGTCKRPDCYGWVGCQSWTAEAAEPDLSMYSPDTVRRCEDCGLLRREGCKGAGWKEREYDYPICAGFVARDGSEEPVHDIRWAAEQLKAGKKPKLRGIGSELSIAQNGFIKLGGGQWHPTIRQLLATNWTVANDKPTQPAERECGDCKHWEPRALHNYYDICTQDVDLRLTRKSVACKDFEASE